MDPLSVDLGYVSGYLFTGPAPGSFAFVPESCIERTVTGELRINSEAYFISGWSRKNYLLNRVDTSGSTLFGEVPIYDKATPGLAEYVQRLRKHVKSSGSDVDP